MKNLALTLFLLGCSCLAMAQDYEVAFQPAFYSQAVDCFENADGELTAYVRVTPKPGYLYKSATVNLEDDNFLDWDIFIPPTFGQYQTVSHVEMTSDSNFIGWGSMLDCDIGGPEFLSKFDKDLNLFWEDDNEGSNREYIDVAENADGDFYITYWDNDWRVKKISSEGELLYVNQFDIDFEYVIALSDNKLIVYNDDNAYQLSDNGDAFVLDFELDFPTSFDIQRIENSGDNHITIFDQIQMFRYNLDYEQVGMFNFSGAAIMGTDYFGEHSVVVSHIGPVYEVRVFDSLLNVINIFDVDDYHKDVSNVKYHNGEILIIGNEKYYLDFPVTTIFGDDTVPFAQSIPFVKAYSMSGKTAALTADAGITGIMTAELPTKESYEWSDLFRLKFKDIQVEVTNLGSTALNEVAVNLRAEPDASFANVICYFYNEKSVKLDNLNLQPGESMVANIGDFNLNSMWVPDSTYQLCAWTSIPNDRLDADHSNDVGCAIFELDVISSVEDLYLSDNLKIYPNPAQDVLILELDKYSENEPVSVEVWNSLGQRVQVIEGYNLGRSIDLNGLARGAYFVKMLVGDDVVGGRFLKE